MTRYFFIFFLLGTLLYGHRTGLSYINIVEDAQKNITITYKKPLQDAKFKDLKIRYPSSCKHTSNIREFIDNGYKVAKYSLYCSSSGLYKKRIWVEGLKTNDRGVLIRYESPTTTQKALLRASTPFIYLNYKSDPFALFVEYLELGMEHIFSGFDHLLFVFSLLLLARSIRALLFAITAFTLAHSITLACGILGIITIGPPFIEASIALSIIFLARELIIPQETLTKKYLWIITFSFGLLHGFGFSSALSQIGLPQNEIPLSLFSFNLGIEIGQIIFVLIMGSLLFVIKRKLIHNEKLIQTSIAYGVGTIASFWFIERLMAF
ncbi:membrane protein, putative [hydrothermal vent metagenome]|uniref:Membrane protein, putative n=1 Tax=hydrothermal vent metagenome TaxID=652676 RepID=A0A1W1BJ73_9ZZZZ